MITPHFDFDPQFFRGLLAPLLPDYHVVAFRDDVEGAGLDIVLLNVDRAHGSLGLTSEDLALGLPPDAPARVCVRLSREWFESFLAVKGWGDVHVGDVYARLSFDTPSIQVSALGGNIPKSADTLPVDYAEWVAHVAKQKVFKESEARSGLLNQSLFGAMLSQAPSLKNAGMLRQQLDSIYRMESRAFAGPKGFK